MGNFEKELIKKIKKLDKKIVFVDGYDNRLYECLKVFVKFNQHIYIIGENKKINHYLKENNITKNDCLEVADPNKFKDFNSYLDLFMELRKKDKMNRKSAEELLKNPAYFGALMIKIGDADCGIGGAAYSSSEFLRAAIKIIGRRKDISTISGAMLEIVPKCEYGLNGMFILADVAVNPDPDEKQLTDIILLTYETSVLLFEREPNIAILYYSTKGSAHSRSRERIAEVIRMVKEINPNIKVDGELQLDAAIVPKVAKIKASDSEIAGKANVLIFPNLAAANICWKAIERLAGASAYGSINQGLLKPYNDLSRGCSANDILIMSAITILQSTISND